MAQEDIPYPPMKSVLSIQSHVVHGYVGNRTSTFPLQVLGWDVDVLNTVQLSNHTGYGKVFGQKLSADEIWTQYEGLRNIGMHQEYNAVLTGYVPTADGTRIVGKIAADIVKSQEKSGKGQEGQEKKRSRAIWILDPVIGDNGRYYVEQDVIPVYREILRNGGVTAVTPNQFEAEVLTGITIKTRADVLRVLDVFHREYRVPHVILTSMKLNAEADTIWSVGSSLESGEAGDSVEPPRVFYYEYPSLKAYITGTGDLFAALLVDRLYKYLELARGDASRFAEVVATAAGGETSKEEAEEDARYIPLAFALGEVLGVVQAVIRRTLANPALKTVQAGVYGNIESMKNGELKLIQSHDLIPGTAIPYQVRVFNSA